MRWGFSLLWLAACSQRPELLPDGGALGGPVAFRISYRSANNRPLYLQTADGQAWLSVLDGSSELRIQPSCLRCPCGQCDGCSACAAPLPKVVQLQHLSSSSWTWSGLTYPSEGRCSGSPVECYRIRSAPEGSYTARFCYGYGFQAEASGGQTVASPQCDSVPFGYPGDGGVVSLEVCDC
ncbi:MAG: hypothetical protein HYZ28_05755 [Myxococcales bacterium]|nr:hypothetical protein [Myxococcales bacterium]